jgi:hypothetical protein
MWANLPAAWEEHRNPARTSTFAGLLPSCSKEFEISDSHIYPVLTQPILDDLFEVVSFELPQLMMIEVVCRHYKKDLNIVEEEREVRRDFGSTFTYRFRWHLSCSMELPSAEEEVESHRTNK